MQFKAGWIGGLAALGVATIFLQAPTFAQDGAQGRELFVTYGCWQCHGYEGQGSIAGPRVAPTLLPYAAFEQLVRRPANVMPAYAPSALPDDVLQNIFAFVQSVEQPPALEDIPELQ
jgi:mono/diheme cytochrome c family protein